ncbi:HTH-type transcriptional activator RhaS (plasmid) [Labrenzia sp. THAF191b]|uniref:helix-turn-helix transcriptional regulator n=1 Tax=unclassified Labrenzia TaxID=2648686 RepID=UPI001267A2A3|nr:MULTISPECIES: helix-turn-helix transcriptional regulator [unclassified Labrenzia]QFT01522.1 HTH-type transcriptional activator RhaS [Labrenzia sp. THAF191b]QFT08229.1 HTH-type transcriptional activator RhaS [Labrenzia sp. THAF191a]QFT19407.1 HTH-type transcriptional activator RhaS [Labrenzia sp. THAF187b]
MFVPTDHHRHYVTKDDLIRQPEARPVRWLGPRLETNDQVLRGAIDFVKIEHGLSVHFSNAEDLHDLKIESDTEPRLSVSLFLEGAIEAYVGPFRVPTATYNAQSRHWQPVATLYSQIRPEKFVRQARRGVRLKKVIISVSHAWLQSYLEPSDSDYVSFRNFTAEHMASLSWHPSSHAISLAEQIIAAPSRSPFQHRLYIAGRVYGLLEEAFRQFSEHRPDQEATVQGGGQDRQRLQAVEHFLSGQKGHWVTAEELAHQIGMSQNSLQRLLSRSYGLSTSRFIRRFMLEKAREALERDAVSIAEASHLAGYSSPANFSTAFKREFGLSPKQVT